MRPDELLQVWDCDIVLDALLLHQALHLLQTARGNTHLNIQGTILLLPNFSSLFSLSVVFNQGLNILSLWEFRMYGN